MALKAVGLLGGSFDPIHLAHVALAQAALNHLQLQEVQLIPAFQPWQRTGLAAAPEHRLAMLEIAIRDHPGLLINPVELTRAGNTYTIDTLEQLPAGPRYLWIFGADQLVNFCTWHRWRDIVALVDLAVAQRPSSRLQVPAQLQARLQEQGSTLLEIPFTPMPISATNIRTRLSQQQDVHELLNPNVLQYIIKHKLYQHDPAITPNKL